MLVPKSREVRGVLLKTLLELLSWDRPCELKLFMIRLLNVGGSKVHGGEGGVAQHAARAVVLGPTL
jgi:hypothetical protein